MPYLGFDGAIYINEAAPGSESWSLLSDVRDVTTTASADQAEISDRGSSFKKYTQGMVDLETTVEVTYRGDTSGLVDDLRDAFLERTDVQIAVVDAPGDPVTGVTGSGFIYWAMVTSNDFNQPLTDGMTVSMTFKPIYKLNGSDAVQEPEWGTITITV